MDPYILKTFHAVGEDLITLTTVLRIYFRTSSKKRSLKQLPQVCLLLLGEDEVWER